MSREQAYVYFYASYCGKVHHIQGSDIFQLKIRIPDQNNLFATLAKCNRALCAMRCKNSGWRANSFDIADSLFATNSYIAYNLGAYKFESKNILLYQLQFNRPKTIIKR